MDSVLTVTLTNDTDTEQTAVLIGAPLKADSALKGRVLTDTDFQAETGGETDVIKVSHVVPAGGLTLEQTQEFIRAFGGRVIGATLQSETSSSQQVAPFVERTYNPIQLEPFSTRVPVERSIGSGDNEGKTVHSFVQPFRTAPNKSLVLTIKPKTEVTVQLLFVFNEIPGCMATA